MRIGGSDKARNASAIVVHLKYLQRGHIGMNCVLHLVRYYTVLKDDMGKVLAFLDKPDVY